jgi:hypothetical protein
MDSTLAELAAFWRYPWARLSSTSVQDGLDNTLLDCTQSKSTIFEALKALGHLKRLLNTECMRLELPRAAGSAPAPSRATLPLWS